MEKYKQLCNEIKNSGNLKITVAEGFTKILNEHIKEISKNQLEVRSKSYFKDMTRSKLMKDPVQNQFYMLLSKCFEIFYQNNSKMAQFIYEIIPLLITKLIQIQHRSQQLNACLLTIYNNQLTQYNKQGNLRKNIKDNSSIQQLYFQQLGKHLEDQQWHKANPIDKLTSSNRNELKAVLFWVWYSNIRILSEESISDFFHTVYIYCGGNQRQSERGLSLFLLQRKDDISLFKYSISDQQLKWILIALYDLAMQKQNYKYEILAVINMVHKKTANQCQFRFSEVAQSAIHLLQDEYANIF